MRSSAAHTTDAENQFGMNSTRATDLIAVVAVVGAALALLGGGLAFVGQHVRPFRLPSGGWGWMKTSGFTAEPSGARTRTWVEGTDWFVRVDIDEDGDGVVDLVAEDWQGPAPERCYRRGSSGWVSVVPSVCQRATEPGGL